MLLRSGVTAALLLVNVRSYAQIGGGYPARPCTLDGIHQPVRITGSLATKLLLTSTEPVYPPEAKQKHLEGVVVLRAIIGSNGLVKKLTPVSGPDLLVKPAMDAVSHWTYRPFILECHPAEVDTIITVNFNLNDAH